MQRQQARVMQNEKLHQSAETAAWPRQPIVSRSPQKHGLVLLSIPIQGSRNRVSCLEKVGKQKDAVFAVRRCAKGGSGGHSAQRGNSAAPTRFMFHAVLHLSCCSPACPFLSLAEPLSLSLLPVLVQADEVEACRACRRQLQAHHVQAGGGGHHRRSRLDDVLPRQLQQVQPAVAQQACGKSRFELL